jgi:hypothetical protein
MERAASRPRRESVNVAQLAAKAALKLTLLHVSLRSRRGNGYDGGSEGQGGIELHGKELSKVFGCFVEEWVLIVGILTACMTV